MTLLALEMVILTMPLSIVHVRPLSVMVTDALTSTLATTGASSARTDGAGRAKITARRKNATTPCGSTDISGFNAASDKCEFVRVIADHSAPGVERELGSGYST